MWHVLYGPDGLARDEDIDKMKARLGEPDIASLNITALDGTATLRDLQAACETMPFLADKRLVIVRDWLDRPAGKRKPARGAAADPVAQLVEYLPHLPDFTALVVVAESDLAPTHPLLRLAQDKASGGRAKNYELPKNPAQWIAERARRKGGEISPAAASLLSNKINRGNKVDRDHAAEDSRLYLYKLDNELEKLVSYAAGRRVEEADVDLLVGDEAVADIFAFVDAISARDGAAAYRVLHGVLARGEQPLIVLTMIARQFRLLIQAKENSRMAPDELARFLGVHPYVAQKTLQQAGRLGLEELIAAFPAIVDTDLAIKSGRMDDVVALDVLVAGLCAASPASLTEL